MSSVSIRILDRSTRPTQPTRPASTRTMAALVAFTGAVAGGLHRLDEWLLSPRWPEPKTAEEVLAWANRIQATEPGFAADLRAAALRAMDQSVD